MNGDYFDSKASKFTTVLTVTMILCVIVSVVLITFISPIVFIPCFVVTLIIEDIIIKKMCNGTFSADDKQVTFRTGFSKRQLLYKNIADVSVKTGVEHGRYSTSGYIVLAILLKRGGVIRFYDCNIDKDIFSSPERLKEFTEDHVFTELQRYIKFYIR